MTRHTRSSRVRKTPHEWRSLESKSGFDLWLASLKKDGLKAFIRHPHHYVVACGLSVTMLIIGHYGTTEHIGAWLYAVLENVSTVLED